MPEHEPELVNLAPSTTAVVRGEVPIAGLRDFFDVSFGALGKTLAAQGVTMLGPAFGLYRGASGETLDLEVGFATDRVVQPEGDVVAGTLPGGAVARLTHSGSFDGLQAGWQRLETWIREQGLSPQALRWESYVTKPAPDMDPRDLRTELCWPVDPR
ncbi:GyrI-like domain-containing protein [Amycolatopsis sp. GM8]|uniref:GyrI-like domain-containing protein n=1 Tax=Amycolatopsis sp. GM8 TaxID=2896530 RepID=UPI001F18515E|nr:GyrI-like domain-containing protein [Amycolatopsis sp. GM8]